MGETQIFDLTVTEWLLNICNIHDTDWKKILQLQIFDYSHYTNTQSMPMQVFICFKGTHHGSEDGTSEKVVPSLAL